MINNMSKNNILALFFFVLAKVLGFFGIIISFGYRSVGGSMLAAAFVFIILSIIISFIEIKRLNNKNIDEKIYLLSKKTNISKEELKKLILEIT